MEHVPVQFRSNTTNIIKYVPVSFYFCQAILKHLGLLHVDFRYKNLLKCLCYP